MSIERGREQKNRVITPEWLATRRIAYVFPPQGTQKVGMGKQLFDSYPTARNTFLEADEALGFSLSNLIFNGSSGELEDTYNAQPAIVTVSEAMRRVLQEQYPLLKPTLVAGHSLGEYSALIAAGVIDFNTAIRIVRERGRIMHKIGEVAPGQMASVLGLTKNEIEVLLHENGDASISNENDPGHFVVSGLKSAVDRFIVEARGRGAKRVDLLKISIASHSKWMEDARYELSLELGKHPFRDPEIPIVQNVDGRPVYSGDVIKRNLINHLVMPVKWIDSLQAMHAAGIDTYIEIGRGSVVTRMVKENLKEWDIETLHAEQLIKSA